MRFTDISGLLGHAIAMSAFILVLVSRGVAPRYRHWLVGGLFLALLIPWHGAPLTIYPRGMFGDFSVSTLLLCLLAVGNRLNLPPAVGCVVAELNRARSVLLGLIVASAALFYPMALGAGMFDPYALGYAPLGLILGLGLLGLLAVWRGWYLLALAIALAIFAWSVGSYESTNLWDYLLDPLVAIYAASALLRRGFCAVSRKTKSAYSE